MVLFCQLDVTARTDNDPAADALTRNMLGYASTWKPRPIRKILYAGDDAGKQHLVAAGLSLAAYARNDLTTDSMLIVGPGGGKKLAGEGEALGKWLKAGGHLLALGIDESDVALLQPKLAVRKGEHIATSIAPQNMASLLAGVGPADLHNRDPHAVALLFNGAGYGVLVKAFDGNVVFCQHVPWQFASKQMNHRRTFRRASYLVTRLAANLGAAESTPVLERFRRPVEASRPEQRWLDGLYLDVPEEWDDPYRFFRW
jgi:beta-galactosidase